MFVLPAIDLKEGRCVRLKQGRKSEAKIYDADPLEVAKAFAAAGADMIHVVDLDGAFNGGESANRSIVEKIIDAVSDPIEFGGGLRTMADVRQLIDYGVTQVVFGTLAVESAQLLERLVHDFGPRTCVW